MAEVDDNTTVVAFEIIKEAFYRTFSGIGEMFFSYFEEDEATRRADVDPCWLDFLQHINGILEGKTYIPPDTCRVVPVGPSNYVPMMGTEADDA